LLRLRGWYPLLRLAVSPAQTSLREGVQTGKVLYDQLLFRAIRVSLPFVHNVAPRSKRIAASLRALPPVHCDAGAEPGRRTESPYDSVNGGSAHASGTRHPPDLGVGGRSCDNSAGVHQVKRRRKPRTVKSQRLPFGFNQIARALPSDVGQGVRDFGL
jgi:hypothetical protein